ncbi:hypothetical protein L2E82_13257 [Cichorium intybus]|uniref:Uncharacterized protein n=1 Tax=Cichorium intybus TaxID=13427 RepID=A0ACB9GJ42_CICIN|nr:hypothetical protein L2E82_13257 [Cichorium intybus]
MIIRLVTINYTASLPSGSVCCRRKETATKVDELIQNAPESRRRVGGEWRLWRQARPAPSILCHIQRRRLIPFHPQNLRFG